MSAGCIEPEYVPSSENIADVFTKPLEKVKFVKLRGALGLM